MNNLIYLPLDWLRYYDSDLCSDNYVHNKWFKMYDVNLWPSHLTSRVHKLKTPWDLAPTVCPIPDVVANSEQRFDVVMDSITAKFCDYIASSGKTPYISWSGGIDSTSILVSLLKVGNEDFLKKLVVLYNEKSINENAFFYYRFIKDKIITHHIDDTSFVVTAENYDKIVILDGEAGNQIMGSPHINHLVKSGKVDFLKKPWRSLNYKDVIQGATEFQMEVIQESIVYSPILIDSVADLLWWIAFNFKMDDVLLRKMALYAGNLTPAQSGEFWRTGIFRHYAQPEMQRWSMATKDARHTQSMLKYTPKKYIYDFDHNDLWFASKTEQGSNSQRHLDNLFGDSTIIALDQDWNKYYISDFNTRQKLGQILQRI
jgi:hypothetical protein